MEDLTGKQLGQYQVIEPLGAGGMATVYKAFQPSMERYVALKILPRHLAAEPDFVTRFKNESKVIANLEHPNILPVHDFGEAEGYTYLVMRYVEGQTLGNLLQGQPLPASKITRIMNQVAAALDYAHSRGVIHRDVKPSNVLLDEHGNCLLSDFGLAKVLISSTQLTASGAFLGTPKYASPEQCLGSSDIDQRSDVYSLGVILYEMVTGRPPFDADTPMGVVIKQIHDPLPLPRAINPDLPEKVEWVILKALSKEPQGRYSTPGELAQAYNAAVAAQVADTIGTPMYVTPQAPAPQPDTVSGSAQRATPKASWKWVWPVVIGVLCVFLAIFILNLSMDKPTAVQPPTYTAEGAAVPATEAPEHSTPDMATESQPEPATFTPQPTYTPPPTYTAPANMVNLTGDYQDQAGCDEQWDPACWSTFMVEGVDGSYRLTVELPAGNYEFKVALNGDWTMNYGSNGLQDGPNYPLSLAADSTITFTYDPETRLVATTIVGSMPGDVLDIELPTSTPRLEKPYVVADQTYFCRQHPNTNSEQHWMFSEGLKNLVLGRSGNWWLIAVDDPNTRTKCCWVGGGNPGGDISIVPTIDYEIDRLNCPPLP